MIGYILLIILIVGFWTLLGFGIKKDKTWMAIVGFNLGLVTTGLLMASSIYVGTKHLDAVSFKNNRDYQQELIYSISDTMSPQTISKIVAGATSTNERIEKNRKHCDNKMCGFLYSKEIAEVEPIDIPKLKYQITMENDKD